MLPAVVERDGTREPDRGSPKRGREAEDALDRARAEERSVERELVARAQAGDKAAVGELLGRHGPGLYRSVLLPRRKQASALADEW